MQYFNKYIQSIAQVITHYYYIYIIRVIWSLVLSHLGVSPEIIDLKKSLRHFLLVPLISLFSLLLSKVTHSFFPSFCQHILCIFIWCEVLLWETLCHRMEQVIIGRGIVWEIQQMEYNFLVGCYRRPNMWMSITVQENFVMVIVVSFSVMAQFYQLWFSLVGAPYNAWHQTDLSKYTFRVIVTDLVFIHTD